MWRFLRPRRDGKCAKDVLANEISTTVRRGETRQVKARKRQPAEHHALAIIHTSPYRGGEVVAGAVFALPHGLQAGDGCFVADLRWFVLQAGKLHAEVPSCGKTLRASGVSFEDVGDGVVVCADDVDDGVGGDC